MSKQQEWADEVRHSAMRHVNRVHIQNTSGGAWCVEVASVSHPEAQGRRGYVVVVHRVNRGKPSNKPADWKRATMVSEIGEARHAVEAYAIGWVVGRWARQRL